MPSGYRRPPDRYWSSRHRGGELPVMADVSKVALVTGANKGIGYEIAAQLAGLGFTIVLGARDEGRREEAAKRLRDTGAEVHPVELDVTEPATITAAARYVDT